MFLISINAQSITPTINFKITQPGVLSRTDSQENYYIIEYNGKTASELYNNVLGSISSIYRNPDKVLSKVDNVSVNVTALAEVQATLSSNYTCLIRFNYTLHFLFKDGKIRINAPNFDCDSIYDFDDFNGRWHKVPSSFSDMHFSGRIDNFAQSFETYLNDIITKIIKKSETISNW